MAFSHSLYGLVKRYKWIVLWLSIVWLEIGANGVETAYLGIFVNG